MDLSDQISLYALYVAILAVVISLVGPRLWIWVDRRNKATRVKRLMLDNLEQLKNNLIRIRDERNKPSGAPEQRIYFDATSISEIGGYEYLYKSLFINNVSDIDITKYPHTVTF